MRHGWMNVSDGVLQLRYTLADGTDVKGQATTNAEFLTFLHQMHKAVGHVTFQCSSSCDFPEEYGMTADELEEIVGGWE